MSHHHDEKIICPNCGSEATGNYCFQCGQETHLHKETFWGLITHFLAHYFHYDSKFWKTLKTLWFSPGKLTLAYWNKQRMRYIPPISLYIFISAVYFLISYSVPDKKKVVTTEEPQISFADIDKLSERQRDSLSGALIRNEGENGMIEVDGVMLDSTGLDSFFDAELHPANKGLKGYFDNKSRDINKKHSKPTAKYLIEKVTHSLPKLFFFMIPMMAMLLKLLFLRRKDMYFIDHTIFALHYHALWFSVTVFKFIPLPNDISWVLDTILYLAVSAYLVVAVRNVYNVGKLKALVSAIFIAFGYGFMFALVFIAAMGISFLMA